MEAFLEKIILDLGMPVFSRLNPPWLKSCYFRSGRGLLPLVVSRRVCSAVAYSSSATLPKMPNRWVNDWEVKCLFLQLHTG